MCSRPRLLVAALAFAVSVAHAASTSVALVRHAPSINGTIDGSVQQLLGESATLNGGGTISGDWLVPGTPTIRLNGRPVYGGTVDGTGAIAPSNYQITLNGRATLGHVTRRTDAVSLPSVSAPPIPTGSRSVNINNAGDTPGDFASVRNLTLNGNVGQFAVPPGTYGDFTANGGSGFTLGVVGATQPSVYSFQHLTLNGQSRFQVVGPVVITVASGFSANGSVGSTAHANWLTLKIYSGGFTLNGGCTVYGNVVAPTGSVIINGSSQLIGSAAADRLTVNGGGVLRIVATAGGNSAPIADSATVQSTEDVPVAVQLSATDADGNALTYTVVSNPLHGSLSGVPPALTYTPAPNFNGTDSFTFLANDGQADSNLATVTLEVAPVNDAPTADANQAALDEDTSANVILSGSDVDGDPLTFTVLTNPAHGSLSGSAPNLIYTPAANYNGVDSFTYAAFDGSLYSAPATYSITVRAVNDAPVATPANYAVGSRSSLNIVLAATDVDNDPLAYQVLIQPSRGFLSGTPPNLTYRPAADFTGVDSFTFQAFDGTLYSAPATITIQVTDTNHPPVANPQSVQVVEDTPKPIVLTGSDPDGDAISFAVLTQPTHGVLSGTAPNVTYTPEANYNGPDSFTFKTRDSSQVDSAPATVAISVTPVNDAPVAAPQTLQVAEDTPLAITLTATDVDNTTLTFTVATGPQHGTLSGSAPNLTYTPARDYDGPDSFTFKANDGSLDSEAATVSINVTPVNDAPVGADQTVTTDEDTAVAITLTATDVDSASLTYSVATPPQHGALSGTAPNLVYTPAQDYNGADSFTFTANDGLLDSSPATVTLTINPVNDAPVATGQTLSQPQDTPFALTLSATDVDGDPLTYAIVTPPAHGVLSGDLPNLTYTPAPNYRGSDTLVFTASDGRLTSNQATVTFNMIAVNHAPVAADQAVALDEDTTAAITVTASDVDGDPLTFSVVTQPAHGTLSGDAPNFVYQPEPNFNGSDTFTFKASDGAQDSNLATVTLTVRPVNDAPVAAAQSIALPEDTATPVVLSATDVDGDPLTYTVVSLPSHGTLSGTAPNLTYTPAKDYNGTDSFTFKAADASLASAITTVSLVISPVNDAPVATPQTITTAEDTPIDITLAATDVDSPVLTYHLVTAPSHGTLSGTAPHFTYTPAQDYNGPDSFTFIANDGALDSAPATVAITLTPVNDAPVANPLALAANPGTASAVALSATDVDSPSVTFAIVVPPTHGTLGSIGSTGNFSAQVSYTAAADFGGYDSFTYVANDGAANSSPATVQITSGLAPRSRTYTSTADFAAGTLAGISTAVPDQISNQTLLTSFDVVWVPNATKGTVIKLDAETGRPIGEYRTAPSTIAQPYPSRIAVDSKGNAWVANYATDSIVKIGLAQNGFWTDRNGDQVVNTSTGLGDVRTWSADSVASAADESILLYVHTGLSGVRHLSVDADDNVWVSSPGGKWLKYDGKTGQLLRTEATAGAGGLGGFIDANGVLYSAGDKFLIWNTANPIAADPAGATVRSNTWAAARDSHGYLWCTRDSTSTVAKYSPTGELIGEYYHGEPWAMGIAIDANDHVWIAHSHCGHSVGHLLPDGTFLGNVEVANHGPVDVSIDRHGRIWVTSTTGVVERINPLGGPVGSDGVTPIGEVDATSGNLGGALWAYGRFTGSTQALASPDGSWTQVTDGVLTNSTWGPVVWNGTVCNDAQIVVEAALSADGVNFTPFETLSPETPTPSGVGRYLKTRVRLVSASTGEAPVLQDLTVGTSGYAAPVAANNWSISAGPDLTGNWPDVVQLAGAFCHTPQAFPTEPTYHWSVVSGPGTVTFSNPASKRPTAQFSAQGTYVLRLTGTLNGVDSSDDVAVTLSPYNRAPYANAGYTTFTASFPPQLWLWGTVRDDGLPVGATVTSTWTSLFGPGTVTFGDSHTATTTATFSAAGVYTLQLSATDGQFTNTNTTDVWIGVPPPPPPPAGLVSWWEASGNGDDHISGNQAFLETGADFTSGVLGGAFRFDGKTGRVRVFAAPSLDTGAQAGTTIEFSVKPNASQFTTILEFGQGGTHGLQVRVSDRTVEVHLRDRSGTDHLVSSGQVLTLGAWNHFAFTYDQAAGDVRLYLNGLLKVTQHVGSFLLATNYDLFMGARSDASEPFAGTIDELSVYNRALYADEVYTIATQGKRPPVSNLPPVVAAGPALFNQHVGTAVTLSGTASDDGQPVNGQLTTKWTCKSGPGTATFADDGSPRTTVQFSAPGRYVLQLTASDGAFSTSATTSVLVDRYYAVETDSSLAAWWNADQTDVDTVGSLKLERFNGAGFGAGRVGDAFQFDGVDDRATAAAAPALDLGDAANGFTIEFWLNPTRDTDAILLQWRDTANNVPLEVHSSHYSGSAMIGMSSRTAGGQSRDTAGGGVKYTVGQWTHVAITYDPTTGQVVTYGNGIRIAATQWSAGTFPGNGRLWVGAGSDGASPLQGNLDELTFYKRPLQPTEVAAIYASGEVGKAPLDHNAPPTLVLAAPSPLQDASGTTTLRATITDDGNPTGTTGAIHWTQVGGPAIAPIVDANQATTTATFTAPGVYTFEADANDGLNQAAAQRTSVRVGLVGVEPDASVAAWWAGEGSGRDWVNGHDLTLLNGVAFPSGQVGQALGFDGIDDLAYATGNSDLAIGSSATGFTIEFWINPSRSATETFLEWNKGGTTQLRLASGTNNGLVMQILARDANGTNHDSGGPGIHYVVGQWNHVAFTYNRSTGEMWEYLNGDRVVRANWGNIAIPTDGTLWVGSSIEGAQRFQGSFDELTLYRDVLSPDAIRAIAAAGPGGKTPPDDDRPPVVNAGPDLVLASVAGSAHLTGNVSDDGRPFGAPTVQWSMVDGPGTVAFADEHAADTQATFSQPGTYTLRLSGSDGYVAPVSDLMQVRVGVSTVVAPADLAAWWPANGTPDEVVTGAHPVTLLNGVGYVPGEVAQAFHFDGTNDFAWVSGHSDLAIGTSTQGFTIEFWINPARSTSETLLEWNKAGVKQLRLTSGSFNGTTLQLFAIDSNGTAHDNGGPGLYYTPGQWNHVAYTYDRTTGQLSGYLNGRRVVSVNWGNVSIPTDGNLWIGSGVEGDLRYQGDLDELALYRRALSFDEINAIVAAGPAGKQPLGLNQAPVVNAGPDQVVPDATSAATLAGSVRDDNRPFGAPVVAWSRVSGPGTVTFGDGSVASTTARFTVSGVYVLQLTASDQLAAPVSDLVEVRVGVAAEETPADLAAWWPLNDTTQDRVTGHDVQSVSRMTYVPGEVSDAASFDGTSTLAWVPGNADLAIGTSTKGFAIEFWMQPARNANENLLLWANAAGQSQVSVTTGTFSGQTVFFSAVDEHGTAHTSHGVYYTAGQWSHVALVYDPVTGIASGYLNGTRTFADSWGVGHTFATDGTLWFGSGAAGTNRFQGALDEVALYRRALTGAEVFTAWQAGAVGKAPIDDNQPPSVSAGPDLTVSGTGTPVALAGVVTDDDRPFGPPKVKWSIVQSPAGGTVSFGDDSVAATTATFTAPGTYQLRLTASDQLDAPVSDDVVVHVGGAAASLPPDLSAWWPFNGDGAEIVGGDDAAWQRTMAFAPGEVLGALTFANSTDYASAHATAATDIGQSASGYSIEFWVRFDAMDVSMPLVTWTKDASTGVELDAIPVNGGFAFRIYATDSTGTGHGINGPAVTGQTGQWVHAVFTYDRSTGTAVFYKDGQLAVTQNIGAGLTGATAYDVWFGSKPSVPTTFHGALDEVSLYKRALSASEVSALYAAGVDGKASTQRNAPPAITFLNPPSGSAAIVSQPITLSARAADADGTVAKVQFFDGATPLGEVPTPEAGSDTYQLALPAGFSALGRHVLTAAAIDSGGATTASTPVYLDVVPVLPTVAITSPADRANVAAGAPVTLTATAAYSAGTVSQVTFFDGGVNLGNASLDASGQYVLTLSSGLAIGSHTLTAHAVGSDASVGLSTGITVVATSTPPTIALTAPTNGSVVAAGTPLTLTATASDADGTVTRVEFYSGSNKIADGTFDSASQTYTASVAAGLAVGSYTVTALATDDSGLSTWSAAAQVSAVAYVGAPIVSIAAPADTQRISAPTDVTGMVADRSLASWTLQYRLQPAEGAAGDAWTTFATGTSLVGTPGTNGAADVPGTLATFDPTSLLNGLYQLRLQATETDGTVRTAGPISVVVEGNMKLGIFSLAFEDLKVPVAGIPITITRTYDSRDTRVGDFGPGWRLALANIRVQKNRPLGTGWYQTPQSGTGLQFYNVDPIGDRFVTVTMPDGETDRFKLGAVVKNRSGDPDDASYAVVVTQGTLKFYPVGDTTAELVPLDADGQPATHFYISGTGDQELTVDQLGEQVYNATRFRLTTKDGTVYLLDETLGLLSLTDLNGNTLVLNRDAQNRVTSVVSTLGTGTSAVVSSVTIHRDATGRVDYIRDPAGKDLDYLYDAQGRLSSFTNRELNVTQFFYENASFPNYLTRIVDPRGVDAIRSEYDAAGKLIKQIDANGKETVFTRGVDTSGRFEKVKDRLGNETTFYYDDRGNVTSKIDPLGAQTSYTYYPDSDRVEFETDHYGNVKSYAYDARGNLLVGTSGASAGEDPSNPTTGYTTHTSYNTFSEPTKIVDPDGRAQAFTYDAATGDLLTQTLGAGGANPNTTTYTYFDDGTAHTVTDAIGNLTTYSYDYGFSDAGYPGAVKKLTIVVTDPAGAAGSDTVNSSDTVLRTAVTLYDRQENQLAMIVTRHLPDGSSQDVVTRYRYDGENRLVATVLPDGRVQEVRYNAIGKTDKAVAWQSLADYEAGDDTKGRVTSYGYDATGNQTSITYPDGASEQSHFDAENRKDWSQDRRGYRTFFVYDSLGRLTTTIYPDADDGVGVAAPTSPTDQRLANNAKAVTQYDRIGRVVTETDPKGATTEYRYEDGCGCAMRKRAVIQHNSLGNLTTYYEYDKAGNVRYVTDPRGNTVESQYDDQGRPTLVKYPATDENPATQTETQYDALGRRAAVIDQEGRMTRYRYDGLGRLVEVRQYLDPSLAATDADFHLPATHSSLVATSYSYDELGNENTQTDALGRTTTFWTDMLGRRIKRVLPKDATEATALSETLQYDGWGNLWKRTDFNGKTTTYGYDALNRLTSKAADPTHPSLVYGNAIARVEYDYDANGSRKAARTYSAANTLLYQESTPHDGRGRTEYKDTAAGRLDYHYYDNGLLKDVVSSNAGGVNVGYRYDEVNRLQDVDDATTGTTLTSAFTYNPNGSLETMTQPNAVVHTYNYDTLNRLRGLIVSRVAAGSSTPTLLHTYEYKLNPSGHRHQVIEAGRTTTYGYDALYRLTSEAIAGDAHGNNGAIGYTLDKVGNRQARTSNLTTIAPQSGLTYNARDWASGDTYDANGSTLNSTQFVTRNPLLATTSVPDVYDFEGRLIVRTKPDGSTINLSYDADGNRIGKTLLDLNSNVTASTSYLVDTNNLTGYAQVVEERLSNATGLTLRTYTYGNQVLSRSESVNSAAAITRYYTFDGHGNVRELTDATGAVTDRYDYDAFGYLIFRSGATANAYLYCGEQYDADLGLYYNRARYLNTDSGRFWSMDRFQGMLDRPSTAHKYLYASADAVNSSDPSGLTSLVELDAAQTADSDLNKTAQPAVQKAEKKSVKYVTCMAGVAAIERWTDMELSGGYGPQGHHPIPKSMGGAEDQALLFLPANTHRAFHAVLNVLLKEDPIFGPLGMNNYSSASSWDTLLEDNPAAKEALLIVLKKAAGVIDKKCELPEPVSLTTFISKNEKRWLGLE